MKANKSQETEILLQQLFSGNTDLRERALLAVPAKDRDAIREVVKVREDAGPLINTMLADLGTASAELRRNYSSQFWRRTAIRALAATVEGAVFSFKRLAFTTAHALGTSMEIGEMDFLREQRSSGGRLPYLRFQDNFKQTLRLFAKAYNVPCNTDFGQNGFEALCQTFELRNRVTHPKSSITFVVTDEETKRAGEALNWLQQEIQRLIDDCQQSLAKMPNS